MRVAVLDTGNPCLPGGGGQAAFLRAILPHLRCEVALCGESGESDHLGRWTAYQVGDRLLPFLPILRGPRGSHRTLVPARAAALAGMWLYRSRVADWADVIYAHSPELPLPYVFSRHRLPVVLHVHGNAHPLQRARYRFGRHHAMQGVYGALVRPSFRAADVLITVDDEGTALCDRFAGQPTSEKVQRVPTCFEEAIFRPPMPDSPESASALSRPGGAGPLVVAFAARIEEGKGLDVLLHAVALLVQGGLDVRLMVAGDGTRRQAMELLAHGLGIETQVRFLGWLQGHDLAEVLSRAAVFALPSSAEGMSIAVLEALACGTPVVATAVGAMRDMVRDGVNGLVLDRLTSSRLADAILTVARHDNNRESVAATVGAFRGSVVATQIERLLETATLATRA